MPIYVEISPLHRLVTIVARGTVSGDEVRGTAEKLADAKVRRFAKIVEVASASFDFKPEDVMALAQVMRGDSDGRGPIAFVVHSMDQPFPRMFATQTAHEGPTDLFRTLHEARTWLAKIQHARPSPAAPAAIAKIKEATAEAWADPDRQGTVILGTRTRGFTTREPVS